MRFLLSAILLLLAHPRSAAAQRAGYDLFQTGPGASTDLSNLGLGNVPLQGVPILTSLGTTDTILHRLQGGVAGKIQIEVTALFLKSKSSVMYHGEKVDIYVTVNNSRGEISTSILPQPDAIPPSYGTMAIDSGGSFDLSIILAADLILVKAGSSVTNSANYVHHQPAPPVKISSTGSHWSSSPPPGYPLSNTFPSGGFYPKSIEDGSHSLVPSRCNIDQRSAATNPKENMRGQATAVVGCTAAE
jgi:hypothetical protein